MAEPLSDFSKIVELQEIKKLYDEARDRHGRELSEKDEAIQALLHRSLPIISSSTTHLGKEWPFSSDDIKDLEGIVFRIKLESKSGCFEEAPESPPIIG